MKVGRTYSTSKLWGARGWLHWLGEEDMLVCGEGRVGGPWIWLRKLGWRHRRRVFGSVHSSAKENKGVFLSNCHLYTYKQKQASILVYTVASRELMA